MTLPDKSPRRRDSAATWVLLALPGLAVALLLGAYKTAAALALVGLVWARPGRKRSPAAGPILALSVVAAALVLFILLPLVNLLATTDFHRVVELTKDEGVRRALGITLSAALAATAIAILFGAPLGYVLARERFAGKAVIEAIVDLPVAVPHTIAGIALLFVFGRAGVLGAAWSGAGSRLSDSWWGIVLAMLFVSVPFLVNQARDGFRAVDPRMEHVARSLGAGFAGALLRVTLPLSWRALLSGALLTFARAVSEFVAVSVIAYYPKTINTIIYEWYNFFGYAHAKPLAALLLIVTLAIFVALRVVATHSPERHD